ncbi:hypothetical protein SLEP1_g56168 [Rubroshorea leprosula]|uniref:Uncharacterized protein n=1 Tax=Rubroshorea leprosula TaxID=152421 RepID=A0AAV5MHK2_9ROSI|nr:hypothetical protein SLEP1_g56168 [Rubroshorea leprosula]
MTVTGFAHELRSRRRVRSAALVRNLSAVSMALPTGAVVPMLCVPALALQN